MTGDSREPEPPGMRNAHDLNNALLTVRAYGELAVRNLAGSADAREELQELAAAAARLEALTRTFLTS